LVLGLDLRLPLRIRRLQLIQQVTLLFEHELGARRGGRRERDNRRNTTLVRSRLQRDPRALAVADDRDPLWIDILPSRHVPDDDARVLGQIAKGGRLGAPTGLTIPALVVPEDEEARVGERACKLAECRNAGGNAVSIAGTGA